MFRLSGRSYVMAGNEEERVAALYNEVWNPVVLMTERGRKILGMIRLIRNQYKLLTLVSEYGQSNKSTN